MTDPRQLTLDAINQIAVYIGIKEKEYDTLFVIDVRPSLELGLPEKTYCFRIEEAVKEMEARKIIPKDGNVYLFNSQKAWGDVHKIMREAWDNVNALGGNESKDVG